VAKDDQRGLHDQAASVSPVSAAPKDCRVLVRTGDQTFPGLHVLLKMPNVVIRKFTSVDMPDAADGSLT
jgi:hypothetical protein